MTDVATTPQPATVTDEFARDWPPRFAAAWNSHDPGRLAALATDDVFWEDPFIHGEGHLEGAAALRDWLTSVWRAIPDLTFAIVGEPLVSLDRTKLGAYWRGTGRNTGPLEPPGFAPTDRTVLMTGFDLHEFRDGLLSRVVTVTDVNSVARQIGAAPPPNSLGERLGVRVQRLGAARMRRA
jgi:steroid delta-isomerase-like uncharacterized protein